MPLLMEKRALKVRKQFFIIRQSQSSSIDYTGRKYFLMRSSQNPEVKILLLMQVLLLGTIPNYLYKDSEGNLLVILFVLYPQFSSLLLCTGFYLLFLFLFLSLETFISCFVSSKLSYLSYFYALMPLSFNFWFFLESYLTFFGLNDSLYSILGPLFLELLFTCGITYFLTSFLFLVTYFFIYMSSYMLCYFSIFFSFLYFLFFISFYFDIFDFQIGSSVKEISQASLIYKISFIIFNFLAFFYLFFSIIFETAFLSATYIFFCPLFFQKVKSVILSDSFVASLVFILFTFYCQGFTSFLIIEAFQGTFCFVSILFLEFSSSQSNRENNYLLLFIFSFSFLLLFFSTYFLGTYLTIQNLHFASAKYMTIDSSIKNSLFFSIRLRSLLIFIPFLLYRSTIVILPSVTMSLACF